MEPSMSTTAKFILRSGNSSTNYSQQKLAGSFSEFIAGKVNNILANGFLPSGEKAVYWALMTIAVILYIMFIPCMLWLGQEDPDVKKAIDEKALKRRARMERKEKKAPKGRRNGRR